METAVYRAVYTKVNAGVQTNAMLLRSAMSTGMGAAGVASEMLQPKFDLEPLTDEMCKGCTKMNEGTQDKPWGLWERQVDADRGMYRV
jgi:hypothetical protein